MQSPDATIVIALLRGINVGGKHKLPMATLRTYFSDAGAEAVQTYIQSGNVVARVPSDRVAAIADTVATRIRTEQGFDAPIIVRSLTQWRALSASHPFAVVDADPKKLHVALLAGPPTSSAIAALDPERSPPDQFAVRGSEVYLFYPNGVARSKLTNAYLDRTLATISTVRNWRTVQQLAAMAEALSGTSG